MLYTKSLSNPPNPPAPFPEREGGDIISTPLSFQGRAGEGVSVFDAENGKIILKAVPADDVSATSMLPLCSLIIP